MTIAAISTVAVSLFLLGGVIVIGHIVSNVVGKWEGKVELNVFLRDDITSAQHDQLRGAIMAMPPVAHVYDVTKDQAKLVVKNSKLAWRSWYDGDQNMNGPIYTKYGIKAIPTTFNTEFIAAGALTTGLALAAYLLIAVAQRLLTPWARRARPA